MSVYYQSCSFRYLRITTLYSHNLLDSPNLKSTTPSETFYCTPLSNIQHEYLRCIYPSSFEPGGSCGTWFEHPWNEEAVSFVENIFVLPKMNNEFTKIFAINARHLNSVASTKSKSKAGKKVIEIDDMPDDTTFTYNNFFADER
mmetsp:Transcript_54/g.78  ORF Transcript_54/g.78 Transcript_54/m.78 type:complete len:144 (-) Transcript_54:243-674(-)